MLTESLRSRSCQPYRLLPAGPESETPADLTRSRGRPGTLLTGLTLPAVALAAAVVAVAGTIGPDARWLSALGRSIVRLGAIPHGVPYAAAPSGAWHNVPVLAELVFRGLQSGFGERGLLAAQMVATVAALALIQRDARRLGATDAGAAAVIVVVLVAGLLAFAGIRAQLFSLVLFPAVVMLLRSDERFSSRRIWLLVPLLALWSNLHGAALVGLGVALIYLFVSRARRHLLESAAVAGASALALCLTPALAGTPAYYSDALTNEAARRGYGLWAPLSLSSGFDVVLIAGAVVLLVGFVCARPAFWELATAVALAVLAAHAARNGIWLLLFLAAPAASGLRLAARPRRAIVHCVALMLLAAAVAGLVRGPLEPGASRGLIARAIDAAHGRPILAEPAAAEQIALAGGRVWIANPLDAFRRSDQRLYLDWLQGRPSGARVLEGKAVILVSRHSEIARQLSRDRGFTQATTDGRFRLFVSRPS
jgi:hypothetical protein